MAHWLAEAAGPALLRLMASSYAAADMGVVVGETALRECLSRVLETLLVQLKRPENDADPEFRAAAARWYATGTTRLLV